MVTCKSGSSFTVAHVRFDAANEKRVLRGAASSSPIPAVDCRELLTIPHYSPGAVSLHIADLARLDSRPQADLHKRHL